MEPIKWVRRAFFEILGVRCCACAAPFFFHFTLPSPLLDLVFIISIFYLVCFVSFSLLRIGWFEKVDGWGSTWWTEIDGFCPFLVLIGTLSLSPWIHCFYCLRCCGNVNGSVVECWRENVEGDFYFQCFFLWRGIDRVARTTGVRSTSLRCFILCPGHLWRKCDVMECDWMLFVHTRIGGEPLCLLCLSLLLNADKLRQSVVWSSMVVLRAFNIAFRLSCPLTKVVLSFWVCFSSISLPNRERWLASQLFRPSALIP